MISGTLVGLNLIEKTIYTKKDTTGPIFGYMTLFAFHADAVRTGLERDLASASPSPWSQSLREDALRLIDEEIERTREHGRSHSTLAYNPDRLIYHPASVCAMVRSRLEDDPERVAAFFRHYFLAGVRREPGLYFNKVGRNLLIALGPKSSLFTFVSERIAVAHEYHQTKESLVLAYPSLSQFPAGATYVAAVEDALTSPPQKWNSPLLQRLIAAAAPFFLLAVSLSVSLAALWFTLRWPAMVHSPAPGGGQAAVVAALAASYPIGISLTVAMVSSQDNTRYSENQFTFAAFALFAAAHALCVSVKLYGTIRRSRKHQEKRTGSI